MFVVFSVSIRACMNEVLDRSLYLIYPLSGPFVWFFLRELLSAVLLKCTVMEKNKTVLERNRDLQSIYNHETQNIASILACQNNTFRHRKKTSNVRTSLASGSVKNCQRTTTPTLHPFFVQKISR